jgi:hypothetical protein
MFIGWILAALLYAAPQPVPKIESVQTSPVVADEFGTVLLPNGSGKLHIEVKVKNAQSVRFWLTHMELGAEEDRQLMREDTDGSDGWTVDFPYDKNEGFSYRLIVEAKRGTETDHKSIFIHHAVDLDPK